jgi:ATP-binding cassette subfamily B protein/subfamily B ATP-binding cassette protein MsbA
VQAYWAQQRNQRRYDALADGVVAVAQRGVLINKMFAFVSGAASEIGRGLVLLVGGTSVLQGSLSVGALVLFLSYVKTMQRACEKLLKTYAILRSSEASIERLDEILNAPSPWRPKAATQIMRTNVATNNAAIRLRNVSFEYAPGAAALQDIDVAIAPGERVGIAGESGAGKSTLVSLIPRLIDPTRGAVEVNGVDLRLVDLKTARSHVGMLLQEAFLLPLTVAENIGLGKPGASRNEIEKAAEAAGAHTFIQSLTGGYDTVLGERGVTLSKGEQQRLAIARAFLRDAPIVVLDEPTAALDTASERRLMDSLGRLTAGKTSLIVSHRLSNLQRVDRVIVLDRGRVVEQGRPAELLALKGYYYRLHVVQPLPRGTEAVA